MIIRITTERKNVKWLCSILSEHFTGFTYYNTIGYWQGQREKSVVFEIDMLGSPPRTLEPNLRMLAAKIKGYNRQECVLIQRIESNSELL